jgi:alpha-1,3-mannosylglycoprotein beta-1,4-N-acetylglucosaminyltransferase C
MQKTFLTIGLATTSTRKESYLLKTIESVLSGIPKKALADVRIVILNADRESQETVELLQLKNNYEKLFLNGTLRIIRADSALDPNFDVHNSPNQNVKDGAYFSWRSKQCIDYANLFESCAGLSDYYLQIEDDIICTTNYYSKIQEFIFKKQLQPWSAIRFCDIGFIGILFKDEDLKKMAILFRSFYDELPVDWLLDSYQALKNKAGIPALSYSESLFQHVGYHRSLVGEVQELKAETFEMSIWKKLCKKLSISRIEL